MAEKLELSKKKFLLNYHEGFYKLLHVPLDWLPVARRNFTICGKNHCNPLCTRIMGTPEGAALCEQMESKMLEDAVTGRTPVVRKCHAGFYDVIIPLFADGQYVGSLCIGQYIHRLPSAAELEKIREKLSFLQLSAGELKNFFRQTRKLSLDEENGLLMLVKSVGEYIVESYNRMQFLESAGDAEPIQLAEKYLRHHYAQPLTIAGVARAVGMSRSYFIRRFTEETGVPPMTYLARYRVQQAMELLKNSQTAVFEVADACGFGSIFALNRSFHKYAGCSPGEYRRQSAGGKPVPEVSAPTK